MGAKLVIDARDNRRSWTETQSFHYRRSSPSTVRELSAHQHIAANQIIDAGQPWKRSYANYTCSCPLLPVLTYTEGPEPSQ